MFIVEQYRSRGYEPGGAAAHGASSNDTRIRHSAAFVYSSSRVVGSSHNLGDDRATPVAYIYACSCHAGGRPDACRTPADVGLFRLVPGNCIGLLRAVRREQRLRVLQPAIPRRDCQRRR